MPKRYLSYVITALLLFTACGKNKDEKSNVPQTPGVDSAAVDTVSLQVPVFNGINTLSWVTRPPEKEGYLYASGWGRSLRANISRNKAMLKAQKELSRLLKRRPALETDSLKLHRGGVQDVPDSEIDVSLSSWRILQQKQIKKGRYWYSFVLIELPVHEN